MGHYKSNLRDIEFNLFEVLGRGDVLGSGPYEAIDADTAREMLKEVARLAEHELAESFEDSDRNPPVYDPQTQAVTMPESFRRSFDAYRDSGFWAIDLTAELGGTVAPPSLRWAVNEMLLGSNPAVAMFAASYGFAKLLYVARQRRPEEARALDRREGLALHDGADRAGCRLRRRRRTHQGDPERRRHVDHHRRQALHHQRRVRHGRQRRALRPRPPRGRRPGHQGPVALHPPQVRTSTSRPASSASATASTSPTSRRRWA